MKDEYTHEWFVEMAEEIGKLTGEEYDIAYTSMRRKLTNGWETLLYAKSNRELGLLMFTYRDGIIKGMKIAGGEVK